MSSRTPKTDWLLLLLIGFPISVFAAEPADQLPTPPATERKTEQQQEEAMAQVRNHLKNAMRALGEAGRLTFESQVPVLQDKTEEAFKETQRLLQELEQRLLPKTEEKKSTPTEKKTDEGMTAI